MNKFWIFFAVLVAVVAGGVIYKNASPTPPESAVHSAHEVGVADISQRADVLPASIVSERKKGEHKTVVVNLRATQVVAELDNGTTYEYWTYNNQVPGPFIRVMEGDTVEISLTHEHMHGAGGDMMRDEPEHSFSISEFVPEARAHGDEEDGHMMSAEEMEHMAAGHAEHSIDLHAVLGPGGGAELTRVGPNETKTFTFKAMRPGLYIYHCASPHVPTHIANGMYGLILVEPDGGLKQVDREFYVVQGELYTSGPVGEKGHEAFDKEKLLGERPEYIVFNGRVGALRGAHALHARVGETVRIFFGVSGQLASNFHIIGEIFDRLYPEGDIISPPHRNVQTTVVPAGGAAMVEFTPEVPGKYLLVDHALTRAIDRGALGELIVDGPENAEIFGKK